MGCTATTIPTRFGQAKRSPSLTATRACLFPDVSVWQGAVGWTSVAAWERSRGCPTAGIFKLGEYTLDTQATRNSSETSRFQFRAGYWFVRNTGCAHEQALIAWAAKRFGLHVVVLDSETPEARGYVACLAPPLQRAGFLVVTYTSPGTWTGGSHASTPLWQAEYGSRLHPLWGPTVAWQCTDGKYGCVTYVPGIGRDDVSVDLGLIAMAHPKPPPPPPDPLHYKVLTHHELLVVREYDAARKDPTHHAGELRNLHPQLVALAHAIWTAHEHNRQSWAYRNEGERFQVVWPRALGQKVA